MRPYLSKTLDTYRLMALGDLDVRGMAACKHLTAHEYFTGVERWIDAAPHILERLQHNPSTEELEAIREALRGIGHRKLPTDLEAALYDIKRGQQALAVQRLAGISVSYAALYERLKTAYTPKKRGSDSGTTDTAPDQMLLIEALDYLDHVESNRKLRVLAVDDVSVVLNAVNSILSPHYEVFALTKASQVENFLKLYTPELFLLDIEMPELNGYDLLSVIRSFEEHKTTPIIFLTGSATVENLKTAVALGASDFISKPIDRDILLSKIESKIVWKKAF